MILAAKWGVGEECILPLAQWLARACRIGLGSPPPIDAVIAVPRSRGRRLRHGRPLSEALAGSLARELRRPLLPPPRRRGGPPQTSLDAASRRSAPAGAFRVPRALARRLAGRSVLLVDDVVTTGATLCACAAALERAGARRVITAALTYSDAGRDRGS